MSDQQTRRQFIGTTSAAIAGLGVGLSPKAFAQSKGANERIGIALIGCGMMGSMNLNSFFSMSNVDIPAVCDVDEGRLNECAKNVVASGRPEPKRYKDFRQLLEQKDVDAVIIATPDHWHAIIFIAACEAGKDIYCEKPISHSFVEAKAMMGAAKHFKRVVQVGTWQRSQKHFQDAVQYVRSGKLGNIPICRAWCLGAENLGKHNPEPVPAGLDHEFWLGPAARVPYQKFNCHYYWRFFYNTGGGIMSDWGVHMIDIVLLGMQESDPVSVAAAGGKLVFPDTDTDVPDTLQVIYRFPKFVLNWEQRPHNKRGLDGGYEHGSEFIGKEGTLIVDRQGIKYFPDPETDVEPPPNTKAANHNHSQNFIDCIKSRAKPNSDIESMAKTTMVCALGNIAHQSGKTVYWDAKKQDIVNLSDVKNCISYQREYRKPWELKIYKA